MPVLDPVDSRIFVAINGAGPPAITEASWYPSPAPEYRREAAQARSTAPVTV
jgi:hypothetical protein